MTLCAFFIVSMVCAGNYPTMEECDIVKDKWNEFVKIVEWKEKPEFKCIVREKDALQS